MSNRTDGNGRLRILQVHDSYSPGWGGEDTVVQLERQLLVDRGHSVNCYSTSHAKLRNASTLRQMVAVPGFVWSRRAYRELRARMAEFKPDIVHVHNTFPELSPSVFWAANRMGVPVVQTLHNFRHICANSLLHRDGAACHECVGRQPWPALRHRCYGESLARTAAVAAVNSLHRTFGRFCRRIDAFILLNDFNHGIFRQAGFPGGQLFTKPNFVPAVALNGGSRKRQAVFAGTISRSKGVPLLLEAWTAAGLTDCELILVGDGPDLSQLQRQHAGVLGIKWLGKLDRAAVLREIAASRFLVFPTLTYENCPMVVLEALSVGTPVVGADLPSVRALVQHEHEGLLFPAGSAPGLKAALQDAFSGISCAWPLWSAAARRTHAERFSEVANYKRLISIYEAAITTHAGRTAASRA